MLVLKRHCGALHELQPHEFAEFGQLLPATVRALNEILGTEKEYVMQFAEGDGFHHVHFHVIARLPDWPDSLKGPRVFRAMDPAYGAPLSTDELSPFVDGFREALRRQLGTDR